MRNMIRLGVAAAGLLVTLPAWADGASAVDRQDALQAELRGENPALPQYVASAPAQGSGTQAGEGSGTGEPAGARDQDQGANEPEQQNATPEQPLNEVWGAP